VLASDQGALPISDNAGTLSVDDGAGSLTVDGTVAISGTVAVTDNSGSLTVDSAQLPAALGANGGLKVEGLAGGTAVPVSGTVTGITNPLPAGTNAIGKLAANSGIDIGDVDVTSGPVGANAFQVQGTVAHDSPAANNPVLNAGYAVNAEPAAVANADVARLLTDLVGKLIVLPYSNPENFLAGKTSDITGTSDTAVIAAQGAGVRLYITQIVVVNSHATVGTWINVKDGATTIYTAYAAPAGGGFALTLNVPLRLTANTALNVACETTGSNVRASASGYKGV
jgi:hypothetical protein